MYFVERKGVYGQGVVWISDDLDSCLAAARRFADADEDEYHEWVVYDLFEHDLDGLSEDDELPQIEIKNKRIKGFRKGLK